MEIFENQMYTVDQAAQILTVSADTIRRYIREGKLHAPKLGGTGVTRILGKDLLGFYEASKPQTKE